VNQSNYIGGAFMPALEGTTLDVMDPARNVVLATVPRSGEADVEAATDAALAAYPSWAATPVAERANWLDRIADELEARHEALAQLESRNTGKPISLTRNIDIPRAVANFRFFAGAVRHQELGCHPMDDQAINYTVRRPVGVFGLITPWNLPLYLLSWKVAPALAMGNTVVAKPSEITPLTAAALAEVCHAVGLPAGVFNVVHGYGHEAGQAIVAHPQIKGISFTGGTETGKRVAATAAPMFKKLSLELGGKNPSIVFADCDLDATVKGVARAAFTNQGQVCLCGSRILVERSLYATFLDKLAEELEGWAPGNPQDPNTKLGSLSSLAHREKVASYVKLAQEEGGRIVTGGKAPVLDGELAEGAFFEPTVVADLAPTCRTSTEEIFGPVVTVHPFDTEEEALQIANGVRYGLAGSVWTQNLTRGHRVAAKLESGMVWVNTWLLRDLRVPFGGMKDSGVGREGVASKAAAHLLSAS